MFVTDTRAILKWDINVGHLRVMRQTLDQIDRDKQRING
jgi:hypothetical protein